MTPKVYYTLDQLLKDLPTLKDKQIFVISDFNKTINLDTLKYKSLLSQIKRQNITIKVLRRM